jgi:hypothetical protein
VSHWKKNEHLQVCGCVSELGQVWTQSQPCIVLAVIQQTVGPGHLQEMRMACLFLAL